KKFLLYAPLARQYTEDDFFHVACSRIGAGSEACPLQVNLATNTCCSRAMVCLRSPVWRRFSALAGLLTSPSLATNLMAITTGLCSPVSWQVSVTSKASR